MLEFKCEDLTAQQVDVIVNASNGIGVMGTGTAGAIRRAGGTEIEDEAKVYCKFYEPQPGTVFLTKSGALSCNKVFHAVTMKFPGTSYRKAQKRGNKIVFNCLNGVLDLFERYNYNSIAIPALATGIGGLDVSDVAFIFISVLKERGYINSDKRIVICDINQEFIEHCDIWLDKLTESDN